MTKQLQMSLTSLSVKDLFLTVVLSAAASLISHNLSNFWSSSGLNLGRILNVYTSRQKIRLYKVVSRYGQIDIQNRMTFMSTIAFVPFSLQDDLYV